MATSRVLPKALIFDERSALPVMREGAAPAYAPVVPSALSAGCLI